MRLQDLTSIIEKWAPREIAWEKDNVGLQIGDSHKNVRRILVALEISAEVIAEAKRKRVDLIVTHHPLLFHPLTSVSASDGVGKLTHELIRRNIAVYSAHTNLDLTRGGVSFALAERLGLRNVDFLHRTSGGLRKISVFVPPDHVEAVAKAMSEAGAGVIGDYEMCSFRIDGTGTFRARRGAKPFVGKVGNYEKVKEVRLEMIAPRWRVDEVVTRMIEAHPYEEVAYDVYPLENQPAEIGQGVVGELDKVVRLRSFLALVRKSLSSQHLRYTGDPNLRIKRVAACGGGGTFLLNAAIGAGADAFVTADVKYHTFQEATGRIALIDAGHYETEHPIVEVLAKRLREGIARKGNRVQVIVTKAVTNPVRYC